MGFEYVYAYLENIQWFLWLCFGLSALALIILIVLRVGNDIDADDWKLLMLFDIPITLFFMVLVFSPSMDHIRDVRAAAVRIEKGESEPVNPAYLCGPSEFVLKTPIAVDKPEGYGILLNH